MLYQNRVHADDYPAGTRFRRTANETDLFKAVGLWSVRKNGVEILYSVSERKADDGVVERNFARVNPDTLLWEVLPLSESVPEPVVKGPPQGPPFIYSDSDVRPEGADYFLRKWGGIAGVDDLPTTDTLFVPVQLDYLP